MKARHVCAVLGVAAAAGAVVFTKSLVATNDAQAPALAAAMVREVPVEDGASVARLALDHRPDGRVMQGPPLVAQVATRRGVDGIAVTKALFAQRRLPPPEVGSELTLVGMRGAYKLKISEIIGWERPAGRGAAYPNAFVSPETAAEIGEEWTPFAAPDADALAESFKTDEGRNIDKSKILLLWAAALTALGLLVNSLFLSIEAKRREIALLRVVGMTRFGVVRRVFAESVALSAVGLLLGAAVAAVCVFAYAAAERAVFPMGAAVSWGAVAACAAAAPVVALAATLVAMKSALGVRPLETESARPPRRRHVGMVVSFAFGFGAFVAVEVWGSSLMTAFVPSPEWPDAIVSILPGGVSSFDVEKLRGLKGVKRIAELQPLQVNLDPLEEVRGGAAKAAAAGYRGGVRTPGGGGGFGEAALPDRQDAGGGGRGGAAASSKPPYQRPGEGLRGRRGGNYRNALLLASEWLPAFRFSQGDRDSAEKAIATSDSCVITEMMARARGWSLGDEVKLDCGRGLKMALKIVGVVDLNWHMVTSRGLLRGLNRMPVNTDGPVFVGFDTIAAADPRPQQLVNMTHLWLDYDPAFLAERGAFGAGREVEAEIVEALGGAFLEGEGGEVRGNAVRLHSRDEVADGTLAHGNDIIGAMAKVPFIFVAVISLGFVAMLVAGADARRREFAVLRAVGATRGRIAWTLSQEAAKVAALGVALGFALGAPAGWLFTFATRKAMSNWGLPASFAVPWATLAEGAAVAFLFAFAVAIPASLVIVAKRRG